MMHFSWEGKTEESDKSGIATFRLGGHSVAIHMDSFKAANDLERFMRVCYNAGGMGANVAIKQFVESAIAHNYIKYVNVP